jgi:ABC-type transport system involved in multi-copper enzyme maturation permease subunit
MLLVGCGLAISLFVIARIALGIRIELGMDQCPIPFNDPACGAKFGEYVRRTSGAFGWPGVFVVLFPILVATFLGAPLFSREFERGTHRLVWTQGVTSTRWAASKLSLILGIAASVGLILASAGGQTRALSLGTPGAFQAFDLEGPAMVAYVVFALAFGALVSVALRRTVAAMLAALVGFVGVRALVGIVLRPNYLPPVIIQSGQPPADAWNLGMRYLTGSGGEADSARVGRLITQFYGAVAQEFRFDTNSYLAANDVFLKQFYQPADRYWLFQSIEAAIFLGLSLLCVLVAIWLVRRRPV